jgi:hypothetical protein
MTRIEVLVSQKCQVDGYPIAPDGMAKKMEVLIELRRLRIEESTVMIGKYQGMVKQKLWQRTNL